MMIRKFLILVWGACLLFPMMLSASAAEQVFPLDAGQNNNSKFLKKSLEKLSNIAGFICHFDQLIAYNDGGSQSYSGELAVRKPGRFRWQYRQPYEQLYIGDGEVIWHYEADLMQAERLSNLESVDPVVMKLLDGRIAFSDIHVLRQEYDKELNIRRYQVQIGDAPAVWLGFSGYGDLRSIERQDVLGNSNQMTLSTCSFIAPAENLFSFTPPDGVEVLDLRTNNLTE
jgi:outer membrane lipoprotein carrier protein